LHCIAKELLRLPVKVEKIERKRSIYMIVKEKRLEKGWSQAQLAEFCGLSLRTIQRIEKGKEPTMESLKAPASVFETMTAEIGYRVEVDEVSLSKEEALAFGKVKKEKRFVTDLITFLVVMPLILLSNYLFASDQIWGGLTALGWCIWLAIDAHKTFDMSSIRSKG
jgi:transcriptional regulator with XRE-family HTH domain